MNESKIQVKVGIVEFSGEGEEKWLSEQLDKILEKVPELLKIEMAAPINNGTVKEPTRDTTSTGKVSGLSLLNIVGKLNSKSPSELAIAAAAFMHFIENKITFSRDDINQTMKKATGYYKDTISGNLTAILTGLEKNSVFTKASNQYAIHADKLKELNSALSK